MSARAEAPSAFELTDVTPVEPADGTPPWRDPAWLDGALAWIDRELGRAGRERVGPAKLRARIWSVVARVPIDRDETVWFKANPPGSGFEGALTLSLDQAGGSWTPQVLAIDAARAWSITLDAGMPLGQSLRLDANPRPLMPIVARYALGQRVLGLKLRELLDLGLPDLRPSVLPSALEAMLDRPALRAVIGHPEGIDDATYERLRAYTPRLRELCAELDALDSPPPSLDHGDLHPNNVFTSGVNARLCDWGDASLAHPFSSLLVLLRTLREFLDADGVAAVRTAYLDSWRGDGYRGTDLERAAELAVLVAPILRASAWQRVFPCFADAEEPNVNAARWLGRLAV